MGLYGNLALREKNLSLQKTDEICRAHETMIQQMKVVRGAGIGGYRSERCKRLF